MMKNSKIDVQKWTEIESNMNDKKERKTFCTH